MTFPRSITRDGQTYSIEMDESGAIHTSPENRELREILRDFIANGKIPSEADIHAQWNARFPDVEI